MTFREKSAWLSLLVTLIVWGGYFILLAQEITGGRPDGGRILGAFVGSVVVSVVLSIAVAIAVALLAPKEADAPADERERLIALKATDLAYLVLSLGVLFVALCSPALAVVNLNLFPGNPAGDLALIAANGILFALVAAEVIRAAGQIVFFRLGR